MNTEELKALFNSEIKKAYRRSKEIDAIKYNNTLSEEDKAKQIKEILDKTRKENEEFEAHYNISKKDISDWLKSYHK